MNALPIPSSSVTSEEPALAWCVAKSPISLALLSAAEASDLASATGSYPAGAVAGAGALVEVDMFCAFERAGVKWKVVRIG